MSRNMKEMKNEVGRREPRDERTSEDRKNKAMPFPSSCHIFLVPRSFIYLLVIDRERGLTLRSTDVTKRGGTALLTRLQIKIPNDVNEQGVSE